MIKKRGSVKVDLLFLLVAVFLANCVYIASANIQCSSSNILADSVEDVTSSPMCYRFSVQSGSNYMRVDFESINGDFNLYLNEGPTSFLSDWDKVNAGAVNGKVTYAFLEPQPGMHTISVEPIDGSGRFRLAATTVSAASNASNQPSGGQSGNIGRATYPIRVAGAGGGIEIGSDFGDQVIFPIEIDRPGRIEVRATWNGSARRLALIINGPDRPDRPNPVAYYARRDGGTPLNLTYNVTNRDFNRGRKWRVRLVNFSGGQAAGEVDISYPRSQRRSNIERDAALNDFVGYWQNVDADTRGITKMEISRAGNSLDVHSWGACVPEDCDHGITNVAFQGNPVVLSRQPSFKREILTLTLLLNGQLRVLSDNIFTDGSRRNYVSEYRLRRSRRQSRQLAAPTQYSPPDDAVFEHYPRTTDLRWSAVSGARSYTVELDCFHCCESNRWCTDVGRTWRVIPNIRETTYTFDFVGAQPGRWRVWAVDSAGREGRKSGWREFRYTR